MEAAKQAVGSTSGPVWMFCRREKFLVPVWIIQPNRLVTLLIIHCLDEPFHQRNPLD